MSGSHRPTPSGVDPRPRSANDRLKERWGSRVAWSLILAVLVHAGAFALWPEWSLTDEALDRLVEPAATGWLAAAEVAPAGDDAGRVGAAGLRIGERADSAEENSGEAAAADDGDGDGAEPAGARRGGAPSSGAASLRDRLGEAGRAELAASARRRSPPPAAAGPEREASARELSEREATDRDPPGSSGSSGPLGGRATTAGTSETGPEDSAYLGRLSALEPEVTTGLGSSEVLLRNPSEVVRFKERATRRYPAVEETEGWVGVTVWIDEAGSVEWAEISESSGSEALDEVTLTLFRDVVEFRPALEEGDRVGKSMIFYLLFPW